MGVDFWAVCLDFSVPIRISEQTRWITSAGSAAMPLPQTKSTDEEAEIIICRGPTQCKSPKEWPCQICIYISANESWLVEEILTNVRRSPGGRALSRGHKVGV